MKIEPRNDYILVKTDEPETKSRGGILLPDKARTDRLEAVVLAVGPGRFDTNGNRVPVDLKVKDRVLVHQFSGQQFGEEKDRMFLIREENILCKLL